MQIELFHYCFTIDIKVFVDSTGQYFSKAKIILTDAFQASKVAFKPVTTQRLLADGACFFLGELFSNC